MRSLSCAARLRARRGVVSMAIGALAALCAGNASASLTENIGVNPIAMSMGNAVTADPPGVASIHFNPAGLTRLKGEVRQDSVFGASIKPYASFRQPKGFDIGGWQEDPLNGTSTGRVRQTLILPVIGMVKGRLPAAAAAGLGLSFHKEGSPWTFATGAYVTQAVGLDRTLDKDDPARFDGKKVAIQRLVYLSPSVGYKWSDTLSFGVAVPIAHQGFALDTDMRMPNKLLGIIGQLQDAWCGDDSNPLDEFGFGLCGDHQGGGRLRPFNKIGSMQFELTAPADPTLNLGVLWEPTPWAAVGATYQSGSKTVLTGRYTFQAEPDLDKFVQGMYHSLLGPIVASMFGMPTSIPPYQTGNVTMVLPFPEHVQVGVKLKPLERVQLNLDAGWTNWKRWDKLTFQFDKQINLLMMARLFGQTDPSKLVIPRGYKNTVDYSAGLQVQLTDKIVVRAGYEPRKSSIPTNKMDLIAPLPDITVKSLGLGYQLKEGTRIDVAASYASATFNLPAETSCNLNCSNFFNVIYNPYAGLDVSGGIRIRYFGIQLTHPF
ncbi:OmpP1/FadL family transporter [Ideonella sp. BN130291]|uniref:OmpP1/FadL family transporter n=1 Tax=Ideonella sp. BN130291 TaxID=3112940 RepID=UPI002E2734AE|nr:outer membrane protein transport protein [Ideonella sp. BN130291]